LPFRNRSSPRCRSTQRRRRARALRKHSSGSSGDDRVQIARRRLSRPFSHSASRERRPLSSLWWNDPAHGCCRKDDVLLREASKVNTNDLVRKLGDVKSLQDTSEPLQNAVRSIVRGEAKNFLHGTWLGHPLHPVLTDIPVGAWTAALALDALESLSGAED